MKLTERPGMNYEAIYKCRPAQEAIFAARRGVKAAEDKLRAAEAQYRECVAKATGLAVGNLLFSNAGCLANGIPDHVYHIKVRGPYGSHENKCVFCGCDNVDLPF